MVREQGVRTLDPEILYRGGRGVDGSAQTFPEPGASGEPKLLD
ncbi:MAG: hypothetical protein ACE5OR_16005 [bacterium]